MLTRAQIAHIRRLGDTAYRHQTGLFIAEGLKTLHELIQSPIEIKSVYFTEPQSTQQGLSLLGNKGYIVRERDMQQMSQLRTPPGILAECRIPSYQPNLDALADNLTLALDGIADPGNMGTIIRTAEWFGVKEIFCSDDCADPWQPKVVQSAMGSLFRIRIFRTNLTALIQRAKAENILVYGAVLDGKPLYEAPLKDQGTMLIIGSESHGIRPGPAELIDLPLTIPRAMSSRAESLNAGIAAAILLAEFKRPKQKPR